MLRDAASAVPTIIPTATGRQPWPRGVRPIAWLILAAIPLSFLAWALYVGVPVAIEARRAAGKVFQTPVQRAHYDSVAPTAPVAPSDTPTVPDEVVARPSPIDAPTVAATTAPTATLAPHEPTPSPAPPTATPYPPWTGREPVTILLLGVDTREGEEGPPRSDTMIVVRVDPVAKRVDMLSIPRDLLVEIPGFYATKINAAYPFGELNADEIPGGGPTLAAQTVEYNFGIRIDYFAEVDIAGMERIVDILGGVMIDVERVIKDDQYPTEQYGFTRVYFTPGLQWMDGRTAVRYSRTRHDDGDFSRTRRQQQVLLAIRDRALESGIISKLPELIAEVGDSVRTDLSPRQVLSLARLGQEINQANVYTHSLAPFVVAETINEGFYWVGDWDAIRALAQNMPDDPNARTGLENQFSSPATPTPTAEAEP